MYNPKDVQFVGKYDYDESTYWHKGIANTFSVGIFQWEMKSNGREMKRGKSVVRVSGSTSNPEKVYSKAKEVVVLLDNGKYNGPKYISV